MNYDEALAFIHGAYGKGKKEGNRNMHLMLDALGNPEKDFPTVHVAGTNGKGSVCAFIHAALRASGKKVGLYTSPFLQRYNERMRVDGLPVEDSELAAVITRLAPVVEGLRGQGICPTEFEIGTAAAFLIFARAKVDIAVIEVGLGGRLDPTNFIHPLVSVIASIGLDHVGVLGDTLEKIAAEKAGIIKRGVPVVTYPAAPSVREVFASHAAALAAPHYDLSRARLDLHLYEEGGSFDIALDGFLMEDVRIALSGEYQLKNAATALVALETLRKGGFPVSRANMRAGLLQASWPGRLEWIRGDVPVLLDGAHNAQGMQALLAYARQKLDPSRTIVLAGILTDKESPAMLEALAALADKLVLTAPQSHRALEANALLGNLSGTQSAHASSHFQALVEPVPKLALEKALAWAKEVPGSVVVICGSLYLVGEARTLLGAPVPRL